MSDSSLGDSSDTLTVSSDSGDSDSTDFSTSSSKNSSNNKNEDKTVPTPKTSQKNTGQVNHDENMEKFPAKQITHEKNESKSSKVKNTSNANSSNHSTEKNNLHVTILTTANTEYHQEAKNGKSNSNSMTSDDLLEGGSGGDSEVNASNIGKNTPILHDKQKKQERDIEKDKEKTQKVETEEEKDNEIPVPNFDSLLKRDKSEEFDIDLELEFQLPPLNPIDDSYFEKLMLTEFSDEVLLAHAKQ